MLCIEVARASCPIATAEIEVATAEVPIAMLLVELAKEPFPIAISVTSAVAPTPEVAPSPTLTPWAWLPPDTPPSANAAATASALIGGSETPSRRLPLLPRALVSSLAATQAPSASFHMLL